MSTNQPKTLQQNRAIFGLGQKRGCAHEDLREVAFDVTGGRTDSIKQLNFDEANGVIKRLGGREFVAQPLAGHSRRTVQHHRQTAGVKQIVTTEQKGKIERLLQQRSIGADGYKSLCRRMLKHDEPRTTIEANKIIEALKAMIARDRVFGAFKKDEKEAA